MQKWLYAICLNNNVVQKHRYHIALYLPSICPVCFAGPRTHSSRRFFLCVAMRNQLSTFLARRRHHRETFNDWAIQARNHSVASVPLDTHYSWYLNSISFASCRGRMQGGGDINSALGCLPDKLKTELALHVNLKTLKKVCSHGLRTCVSRGETCGPSAR